MMSLSQLRDLLARLVMTTTLVTVPAHYDGTSIRLDAEVELKPDTRLLVMILDEEPQNKTLVWGAMKLSEAAFARVWDNEEHAVYDQEWTGGCASRPVPLDRSEREQAASICCVEW